MQCSGSYSCMALFYCSSLIKTLFSGTKGRVLVCCFLSANYLAFCLHAVCVLLFLFFDKWHLFFSTRQSGVVQRSIQKQRGRWLSSGALWNGLIGLQECIQCSPPILIFDVVSFQVPHEVLDGSIIAQGAYEITLMCLKPIFLANSLKLQLENGGPLLLPILCRMPKPVTLQLIAGMSASAEVDLTISMAGYCECRHYTMRI